MKNFDMPQSRARFKTWGRSIDMLAKNRVSFAILENSCAGDFKDICRENNKYAQIWICFSI